MPTIHSFAEGAFQRSAGEEIDLLNPATEEVVATARIGGVDADRMLAHLREQGRPALQELTFAGRGEILSRMAAVVHEHRDVLIETSVLNNGATRSGAKFDVDGASATLAAYAELARELGDTHVLPDGDGIGLARGARLWGRHCYVPRPGVAVFINAFNFPAWGFAEKAATALLAGMPILNKPATLTSWTAGRLAEILVEADVLPRGAFAQLLGPVTSVLERLGSQDIVAFTGSSQTAEAVRTLPRLVQRSVPVNVEADSLNAAVLAGGVEPDSDCYQTFLRDVVREMTEKTGQKCTATRRVLVPEADVERVAADLADRLAAIKIGNPSVKGVEMGPLATRRQMQSVHAGMDRLRACTEVVCGELRPPNLIEVPEGKGFFTGPTLLIARSGKALEEVHREEVFGPLASILPYSGQSADAIELVGRGGGSLVSTIYSDDRTFTQETARGLAPWCGRVCLVDSKLEGASLPPGMVLPQLLHGGPGRAGGGEELGGRRGLEHYLARTALQGGRALVDRAIG